MNHARSFDGVDTHCSKESPWMPGIKSKGKAVTRSHTVPTGMGVPYSVIAGIKSGAFHFPPSLHDLAGSIARSNA